MLQKFKQLLLTIKDISQKVLKNLLHVIRSIYLKGKLTLWAWTHLPAYLKIADTEMIIPARNWIVALSARIDSTKIQDGRMWYEPDEFDAFSNLFKGGEIFWDAGSNMGYYLLFAAGHGAKEVIGFDVIKDYVNFANKCLKLNRVHGRVYQYALGEKSGPVATYSYTFLESECESRSLDEMLVMGVMHPNVLKMDIEGAEGVALVGGKKLFAQFHPCLDLSVHPKFLLTMGSSEEEVFATMAQYGYVSMEVFGDTHYMQVLNKSTQ